MTEVHLCIFCEFAIVTNVCQARDTHDKYRVDVERLVIIITVIIFVY